MVPSCLRRTNLPRPNDLCPATYWTSLERLTILLNGCRTAVRLRLPTPATAQAPVLFCRPGLVGLTPNRHRGNGRPLSPATPPYMRVRIRRFGGLSGIRTNHRRKPEAGEVGIGQGD